MKNSMSVCLTNHAMSRRYDWKFAVASGRLVKYCTTKLKNNIPEKKPAIGRGQNGLTNEMFNKMCRKMESFSDLAVNCNII